MYSIIGLNKDCKGIVHHDRIDVSQHNFISFTMGTPKHLHDKLLSEYNFYHGFSKFAAYFITPSGDISVCAPVIPHNFQCSLRSLEVFGADFLKSHSIPTEDDKEEEEDDLFDLWLQQSWTMSVLSDQNSHLMNASLLNETQSFLAQQQQKEFAAFNGSARFVHRNQAMQRDFYRLKVHRTTKAGGKAVCTKLVMLDLDSFFFADGRLTKRDTDHGDHEDDDEELAVNVPPILVRVWSDHSVDIVCCTKPIHCSWSLPFSRMARGDDNGFDAIVVCRNWLDFDERNEMAFVVQKCVQNLDELVLGHAVEGVYRLKMKWLRDVPLALNQNFAAYFDLLRVHSFF